MSDLHDTMLDILRKAYQIEVDGYTFYSLAADRAESRRSRTCSPSWPATRSSTRAT